MVEAHALGGLLQRRALLDTDAGQGQLQALARQDQLGHGGRLDAVEALGVLDQRGIAALAHALDDVQHALVDRIVGHAFPAQQMIQMTGKLRIGGVESADGDWCGHGKASLA
ncbi:hypothetical protein D9M71_632690 [compost metagenome]